MTPLQALERIIKNVQAYTDIDIEQELDTIAEALHVPTADEVCEELGKIENTIVRYNSNLKAFIDQDEFTLIVMMDSGLLLRLYDTYPPHLIALISRFYEAQE